MTEHKRRTYVASLLASTALAAVGPRIAYGQATEPASDDQASDKASEDTGQALQEVVVRGKYLPTDRTSGTGLSLSLIETPAAVSVVTEEMLRTANASTAYDVADMVPGIEKKGKGSSQEVLIQRGSQVGMRINGIGRLGEAYRSFPDAFAMERIEFVRGPSTAIYSMGDSFAGEVNSILKVPKKDFRTELGTRFGSFGAARYEADVTGAIPGTGERLTARAVGSYNEYDSPVSNVTNSNRDWMGLLALAYESESGLKSNITYYEQDRDMDPVDGCSMVLTPEGTLALPDFLDAKNFYCSDPDSNWQKVNQKLLYGSMEYEFSNGWGITAKGAHGKGTDQLSYYFPWGPAGSYALDDYNVYLYTYDPEVYYEELTFNMSLVGDFELFSREHQFLIGAEYNERPASGNGYVIKQSVGVGVFDMRNGGLGILADGSPIPDVDREALPTRYRNWMQTEGWGTTMQLHLNPTDRLDLMLGLQYGGSKGSSQTLVPAGDVIETRTDPKLTGRLGVVYQLTDGWGVLDDARVYASYYEKETPNNGLLDVDGNPLTAPTKRSAQEFGVKAEFLDGALTGSLAVYEQKIANIPSRAYDLGDLSNIYWMLQGERVTRGVEVDLLGELRPGWNVAVNYGYTDSVIVDSSTDPTRGLVEYPTTSVPKHRASLFTTYEFLEGSLRGLRIGGSVVYKDDYPFVDVGTALIDTYGVFVGSGYTRVDLRASYRPPTGMFSDFEIYGHLENVTDVDYFHSRNGDPRFTISHGAPRTVTVGLRYLLE